MSDDFNLLYHPQKRSPISLAAAVLSHSYQRDQSCLTQGWSQVRVHEQEGTGDNHMGCKTEDGRLH